MQISIEGFELIRTHYYHVAGAPKALYYKLEIFKTQRSEHPLDFRVYVSLDLGASYHAGTVTGGTRFESEEQILLRAEQGIRQNVDNIMQGQWSLSLR